MQQNRNYISKIRTFLFCVLAAMPLFNGVAQEIDFNSNSESQTVITFKGSDRSILLKNFSLSPADLKFSSDNADVQKLLDRQSPTIFSNKLDLSDIDFSKQYKLVVTYTGNVSPLPAIFNTKEFQLIINTVDPPKSFQPSEINSAARNKLVNDPNFDFDRFYNNELGIYLEKNVVHIFIDQNGNFIETAIPTTATEKYIYQFHVFQERGSFDNFSFKFSWEGKYTPTFNITRGGADVPSGQDAKIADGTPDMEMLSFEKIGPFTDNFKVKIEQLDAQANVEKLLIEQTVRVAKLYHLSISTGLISTTLRNPQNIQQFALPNGDTTLVADDPSLRGVVTLFASYYPKGRSFLLTPSGGPFDPSRIAIQVGAQLNNNLAENFFLGLSHDFARGGSVSYGAHFGRRNYVAGKPDFKFGSDKFDLEELVVKKDWDLGFYFGVVIDVRVAFQLIGSIGNPQFQ